jgi:dihydrofolate synthase/folylpolyglutamate synthase
MTQFSDLDWLFELEHFGIKFGLGNITAIVEALGHPERAFASIHVAGTNGKGSVTAMVDAALLAAGHRSARYTSPHLIDLTERFVVGGEPVSQAALVSSIAEVRQAVERLSVAGRLEVHPTFFEVATAVAFELFRRAGVEVAVCEVGLGGRLDATNVLSPIVTAITSIAFDHQQYLGHTLRDIAVEKAGIIKPGVPVVVGRMAAECFEVIERIAKERDAPLVRASDRAALRKYGDITLALKGDHQIDNALVAAGVLEILPARGVGVPPSAVADALAHVKWPGRLEQRRLSDGREVWLDAAHNPAGATALAAFLASNFKNRPPLVFAAMRDKDASDMLRALAPHVGALIVTKASNPRSAEPAELADLARRIQPGLSIAVQPSPAEALAAAWRLSRTIVVAGSIFLLGDVLRELGGSWYPQP